VLTRNPAQAMPVATAIYWDVTIDTGRNRQLLYELGSMPVFHYGTAVLVGILRIAAHPISAR
jgi:hypothetical protein